MPSFKRSLSGSDKYNYVRKKVKRPTKVPRGIMSTNEHAFKRTVVADIGFNSSGFNLTSTTSGTGYGNGIGVTFQLNGAFLVVNGQSATFAMPSYTEFTSLYDSYIIDKVDFKMFPYENTALTVGSSGGGSANQVVGVPVIASAIDFDDGTYPATESVIQQYSTYKLTSSASVESPHKRTIYPKAAQALYDNQAVLFSAYGNAKKQWVQTQSPTAAHYALKIYTQGQFGGSYVIQFRLMFTYHMRMKTTK